MSKKAIVAGIIAIIIVAAGLILVLRTLPVENTCSTPLCGGYTEAREPGEEEYQLFREVTDTVEGMTFTPLSVQTQVVAGINYRFYCRFSDGSGEHSPGHCYLTIYKPLPGQGDPSISSIEKIHF